MDKEKQTYMFQVLGVAGLALILVIPVMWYAKKAETPQGAISLEQLKSFELDTVEVVERNDTSYSDLAQSTPRGGGMRGKFSNIGEAIVSVNINNIVSMTRAEFETVGATPFSLMNTVMTNLKTPQVIEVVFDNEDIVKGFLSRQSISDMMSNYLKVYDLVASQDFAVDRFVGSPAVRGVLSNESLLRSLLKSKLFTAIFNSPSAKYFINNPSITKQLVEDSQALAPYLKNESLKKVLLEMPTTRQAAKQIFN